MKRDESERKKEFITAKQRFQREHRAKGLCLDCHNIPQANKTRCDSCMEKRRINQQKRQAEAKAKGLCCHCRKQKALPSHRFCEGCYLKNLSVQHFGTSKCWVDLKRIWDKQKGLCALSGYPLTLGENAELDHVIPKAKKGCKDVTNVQWVLHVVNRMKRDMFEADFLKLIEDIYLFHKRD